jgi:hypothetical protein
MVGIAFITGLKSRLKAELGELELDTDNSADRFFQLSCRVRRRFL